MPPKSPASVRTPQRYCVRTTLVAITASLSMLLLAASGGGAADQLADPAARKAALTCQKLVAGVAAKVTTGRLKALDTCTNAALVCIQTKSTDDLCLTAAAITCQKSLSKAASAAVKAQSKITSAKSCTQQLRYLDLLSGDGLGFGRLAPACEAEFGLDICQGIQPLADCVVRSHERAAATLYATSRPRAAELIELLPGTGLPTVDGLTFFPGCETCGVQPAEGTRVTKCAKRITKATTKLVDGLDRRFRKCAQQTLKCLQAKVVKPNCLTAARAACDTEGAKLPALLGSFVEVVATGDCSAESIDFARLASADGLNLSALGGSCTSLGLSAPNSSTTLASCLAERARCTAAGLVQRELPRTGELAAAGALGALADAATTTCPTDPLAPRTALAPLEPRPLVFGSITKLVKTIRNGTLKSPPLRSSPNAPRTVSANGPRRIGFGGLVKIGFRYRLSAPRSAGAEARLVLPPSLIVAADGGQPATDYFEVPLPMPPSFDTDVDGEIEVTFQDVMPSCAANLAFATNFAGVVSTYTPLTIVLDPALPTEHTARLRLFNVDDRVDAVLNGTPVLTAFFSQDSGFVDVTPALACGENVLELKVTNSVGPYTHGATLLVDNLSVVESSCGTLGGTGCHDPDATVGLVVDERNYFCVPCDGVPCPDRGTCANPFVAPPTGRWTIRGNSSITNTVAASCALGTNGRDAFFTWTPAVGGCYSIQTCGSGPTSVMAIQEGGACATANTSVPHQQRC